MGRKNDVTPSRQRRLFVKIEVKIIPSSTVGMKNDRADSQKSRVAAFRKVVVFFRTRIQERINRLCLIYDK